MKYTIETPNKMYNGVTEGVPFASGVGETESKVIRNILVNDYGYTDVTEAKEKPAKKETPTSK